MKKWLVVCSILMPWLVQAQQVLTLEDCRKRALEANQQVTNTHLSQEIAKAKQDEALTNKLPSVDVSGTGSYFTESPVLSLVPTYSSLASLNLNQPIYTGGTLRTTNELAQTEAQIASLNRSLTEQQVLYAVEEAYLGALSLQKQINVAEDYVASLSKLEEKIGNYYDAKMVNKTELLEVQVAKNQAIYQLKLAKDGLEITKDQVSALMGGTSEDWELDGNVPLETVTYQTNESYDQALKQRPETLLLDQQMKISDLEQNLIQAAYRPEVGLGLSLYSYMGEDVAGGDAPGGEAIPNPVAVETNQLFGAAFLNVSIPIYNWGQKKHRVRQNALKKTQLSNQKQALHNNIGIEVRSAIYRMEQASLNLELTKKSQEQASENLRITNDNYAVGIITSEEVLEAEALNQQAQVDYINARVERKLSISNYLKSTGQLTL